MTCPLFTTNLILENNMPINTIFAALIIILIIAVLREVITWWWKINEIVSLLRDMNRKLDAMS